MNGPPMIRRFTCASPWYVPTLMPGRAKRKCDTVGREHGAVSWMEMQDSFIIIISYSLLREVSKVKGYWQKTYVQNFGSCRSRWLKLLWLWLVVVLVFYILPVKRPWLGSSTGTLPPPTSGTMSRGSRKSNGPDSQGRRGRRPKNGNLGAASGGGVRAAVFVD